MHQRPNHPVHDFTLLPLLQAAKPQAADGGGGGSGPGVQAGTAQPRIRIKLGGSSGDLGAATAAAQAPAAAPKSARVTTKSGRSAGRAYTRADADASDSDSEAAAGEPATLSSLCTQQVYCPHSSAMRD